MVNKGFSMRKYHTVLVKYVGDTQWCIHFGDYDKEVAQDELADVRDSYDVKAAKLITTGDKQEDIMAKVNQLNS
jgi:hypothetical protein